MSTPWKHLPIAMPNGALLPHLSARHRTAIVDTVFQMVGGTERLADWAAKPENYGEFVTKVWAKGMAKPVSVELQQAEGLEGLLAQLDAGEHAKVISPDGMEHDGPSFDIDELVTDGGE